MNIFNMSVTSDGFQPGCPPDSPLDVNPGDSLTFTLAEKGPVTVTIEPHLGLFSSFTLQSAGASVTLTVAPLTDPPETKYTIKVGSGFGGGMTGTIKVGGVGGDKPHR